MPTKLLLTLFILAMPATSLAQVPQFIPYSGRLTDGTGSTGAATVTLVAKLYSCYCDFGDGCEATGSRECPEKADENDDPGLVWHETHSNVKTVDGYFSVHLGKAGSPFPSVIPDRMWIQFLVEHGGKVNALPKQEVGATPYAVSAGNGVPVGTVVAFAGDVDTPPPGWLVCDGTAHREGDFPALFAAIGIAHGRGDTKCSFQDGCDFNLPDYRGRFLRGVDAGADRDKDSAKRTAPAPGGNVKTKVGSVQSAAFQPHAHGDGTLFGMLSGGNGKDDIAYNRYYGTPDWKKNCKFVHGGTNSCTLSADGYGQSGNGLDIGGNTSTATEVSSATDTRPANAYVNYIIKH